MAPHHTGEGLNALMLAPFVGRKPEYMGLDTREKRLIVKNIKFNHTRIKNSANVLQGKKSD